MSVDMERLQISERAVAWLVRLETATPKTRAEFLAWLEQSPLHVHEFLAAQSCHITLRLLFRDGPRIDIDPFVQSADNVHELGHRNTSVHVDIQEAKSAFDTAAPSTPPVTRSRWLMAAAVAFVALLVAWTLVFQPDSSLTISTDAGEWKTKWLDDGSIARVGPRTKLFIEFTDGQRLVQLIQGEALFHVAKDPERPFIVKTRLGTARAVGTAFAVTLEDETQFRVDVKEGIVAVARREESIKLTAGEQVIVGPNGPLAAKDIDVETALAWATRRLIFKRETIGQAVREFNRRNELQIKVLDPALQVRGVRGVFDASDPQEFAAQLERQGTVAVIEDASGALLIVPHPDATAPGTKR